jgi:hypothetical protein
LLSIHQYAGRGAYVRQIQHNVGATARHRAPVEIDSGS